MRRTKNFAGGIEKSGGGYNIAMQPLLAAEKVCVVADTGGDFGGCRR